MKTKEIYDNLFLFTFSNQYEMNSTFFRIQEFYESSLRKIKGKYVTLEQAIDSYAQLELSDKPKNIFSYFTDWWGFNVPGHIVKEFYIKFWDDNDDLLVKEQTLLHPLLSHINVHDKKFYIIGAVEGDKQVVQHEIAHALFYLIHDYKKTMKKLIKEMPKNLKLKLTKHLLGIGYSKIVIEDEIHAYCSTGLRKQMLNPILKLYYMQDLKKFETIFNEYYKAVIK